MRFYICVDCNKEMVSVTEFDYYWEEIYCKNCYPEYYSYSIKRSKEGYVYLIKSGQHYKIGKTNDFQRRFNELKILLPLPAEKIHIIRTNNCQSLEKYWHNRFYEKNTNGEWFLLSENDVSEFMENDFIEMV